MTHAAVLRVTANGTNTSPVTARDLGARPHPRHAAPPPPQDVPAIEPDIRGAKTMREQLAKHREIASCAGCHAKIDPAGNALENFDVIGGWRDFYRVVPGKGRSRSRFPPPSMADRSASARGRRSRPPTNFPAAVSSPTSMASKSSSWRTPIRSPAA